ncbi:MAG: MarR family transcriptional regulator [Thermoanaerobacterales bacterium]|nr:MarR family transcriptional regulator [Thermoanaerobacterales bacterium]
MDRDEAARTVTEAVTVLFLSAENQARFHHASERLGVSPPMLKALLELEPDEQVPMRDLAVRWGVDASFVTVVCDGLEARGLIERRVAPWDRRVKVVSLTERGVEALEEVQDEVFGPRAGFDALTPEEQVTLATLLRKMVTAQVAYDETIADQVPLAPAIRRLTAARPRFRGGGPPRGRGPHHRHEGADADEGLGGDWREHLAAHREEIRRLKEEIARISAAVRMNAQQVVEDPVAAVRQAKRTKAEVKAVKNQVKAEAKAVKAGVKSEVKSRLKGGKAAGATQRPSRRRSD